jgi:hypothetical protein
VIAALPKALRPSVTNTIPQLGDPALLSLSMSEAAERYGVASDVVPRRKRNVELAYA